MAPNEMWELAAGGQGVSRILPDLSSPTIHRLNLGVGELRLPGALVLFYVCSGHELTCSPSASRPVR
jgi:hypothetical protein